MIVHPPSLADVAVAAAKLGFSLSAEEVALFRERVVANMDQIDALVQDAPDASQLPTRPTSRDPGYKPEPGTDRYRAWLWRCHIEGDPAGELLAGKTVSFKDHVPVAGLPLTFAAAAMEGYIADFDATIVTRLLSAGATVIGKNNMDNFSIPGPSMGGVGDRPAPVNPRAPGYATGGSSSGSGAAVAAGEVDISMGGDQGGSIRIPAAWCGIVGLKPSFGAVPHTGIVGSDPTVDFTGPMTLTVKDCAAAFQAVAGKDGFDHRQEGIPAYVDVLSTLEDGAPGLRIGVLEEGFGPHVEPEVKAAVEAAVDAIEGLGAKAERVSLPIHSDGPRIGLALGIEGGRLLYESTFVGAFSKGFYPKGLTYALGKAKAADPDLIPPNMKLRYITSEFTRKRWYGSVYAVAQTEISRLTAAYDSLFERFDVLVMPTTPIRPPMRGDEFADKLAALDATLMGGKNGFHLAVVGQNTQPFNLSGHPALAIPVPADGDLPVSLQLVGPHLGEPVLLRLAQAYAGSINWDALVAPPARAA